MWTKQEEMHQKIRQKMQKNLFEKSLQDQSNHSLQNNCCSKTNCNPFQPRSTSSLCHQKNQKMQKSSRKKDHQKGKKNRQKTKQEKNHRQKDIRQKKHCQKDH